MIIIIIIIIIIIKAKIHRMDAAIYICSAKHIYIYIK